MKRTEHIMKLVKCRKILIPYITGSAIMKEGEHMTNEEAREIVYDNCPVKCASCESECNSTAVGVCKQHLELHLEKETTHDDKK